MKDVGLNADWCVSAYRISPGRPNRDPGFYVTDDENGEFSVVFAHHDVNDTREVYAVFDSLEAAVLFVATQQ